MPPKNYNEDIENYVRHCSHRGNIWGDLHAREDSKFLWTVKLDQMAKKRSLRYKIAMHSNDPEDKAKWHDINREIKKEVRRSRERCYSTLMQELCESEPSQSIKRASTCFKAKEGNISKNNPSGRRIQQPEYTTFICNQFEDKGRLGTDPTHFELVDKWEE